ncbi:hypothetical protein [Streptomyces sp. NPDC087300]|uniref:hypothetical protein n=1 Tax=Streptomyces sp. NPDC087300 TaxID=3365780 RepID=UPI00381D907F
MNSSTGRLLVDATGAARVSPGEVLERKLVECARSRPSLWQLRHFGTTLAYAVSDGGSWETVQAVVQPTMEVSA